MAKKMAKRKFCSNRSVDKKMTQANNLTFLR